jgi:hypothetical protein
VVQARGAVGRGVALERGTGEELVTEERTASRARFENGRSVAWQRGKKRGRGGGVRPQECHAVRGGVVGPGPTGRDPDAARWHRRGRALVVVRAGRREWHMSARGPAREENGWPSVDEQ